MAEEPAQAQRLSVPSLTTDRDSLVARDPVARVVDPCRAAEHRAPPPVDFVSRRHRRQTAEPEEPERASVAARREKAIPLSDEQVPTNAASTGSTRVRPICREWLTTINGAFQIAH